MKKDSCSKEVIVTPIRIRRVTGYLGYVNSFNNGKFAELKERTSNDKKLGLQRDKVLVR